MVVILKVPGMDEACMCKALLARLRYDKVVTVSVRSLKEAVTLAVTVVVLLIVRCHS